MTTKAKTRIKELNFVVDIIIEPDEKSFYAHSPSLPGLMVDGETKEEALKNARDGAIALLHSMVRDGNPIPLCIINAQPVTSKKVDPGVFFYQEANKVVLE
jgi:predicted RNase H-like HicB family nuclease